MKPEEALFLDDLGQNLKTAAEIGMQTLRVPSRGGDEAVAGAIAQLEQMLGGKNLRHWVPGTVTPVGRVALPHAPLRAYLSKLLRAPAGVLSALTNSHFSASQCPVQ